MSQSQIAVTLRLDPVSTIGALCDNLTDTKAYVPQQRIDESLNPVRVRSTTFFHMQECENAYITLYTHHNPLINPKTL